MDSRTGSRLPVQLARRGLTVVALIGLGFGAAVVVHIAIDGAIESVAPADLIVVLGNEVEVDGSPSKRLVARLDRAASLHREGWADTILVSGGVGGSGHNEADVMARYLVDHGIPESAVIIDRNGINTRATASNAADVMADQGWRSVLVVSQFFHLTRSELAFRQAGVEQVHTARPTYVELRDGFALFRESIAVLDYRLGGDGLAGRRSDF